MVHNTPRAIAGLSRLTSKERRVVVSPTDKVTCPSATPKIRKSVRRAEVLGRYISKNRENLPVWRIGARGGGIS